MAHTNSTYTIDEIYQILETELVSLTLKPGDAISENSLCQRFCVSRTPIRSVLQRLEQNGFVKIIPHKGTVVTPVDLDIANQMIYERVALETMVLRDFTKSCSATDLARVHFAYEQMQESAKIKGDPEHFDINRFLAADLKMHELWFTATGKTYLWERITAPHADYSRLIRLDIVGAKNVPDVLDEHAQMIDIIEHKKFNEIEPLLSHHLYGGVRRLGSGLFSDKYAAYFNKSGKPASVPPATQS